MSSDKQQQTDIVNDEIKYSGPNYDPITACSTLLVGNCLLALNI